MRPLVSSDLVVESQTEPDIVKSLQQALATERVDTERQFEAFPVSYSLGLQIDSQAIALISIRPAEKIVHLSFGQRHRQNAILEAVVIEDICVAGRDDRAKAVVQNCPWRVLPARPAPE